MSTPPAPPAQPAPSAKPGLAVLAPLPGLAMALAQVPDQVFAEEMVGPGAAVDPDRGPVTVLAPVAGRIATLHPHAFVVATDDGAGVLVHCGIDTVQLRGEGFSVHVAAGDRVSAGQPVVSFDAGAVERGGRSPVCPVVALDAAPGATALVAAGRVDAGAVLFTWQR